MGHRNMLLYTSPHSFYHTVVLWLIPGPLPLEKSIFFSSIASRICGQSLLREARLIKIAETKQMKNKVAKGSVVVLQL